MATETSRTFKGFKYKIDTNNSMPGFNYLATINYIHSVQLVGGFIDVQLKLDEDNYEHVIFNSEGLELFSYVQSRNYKDEVREVAD